MSIKSSTRAAILTISIMLPGTIMAQDGPDSVLRGTKEFRRSVLVSGLAGPWELTWGPDNMLWVTERTGKRITRIDPATGQRSVAITIDEVFAPGSQDGLLGMALHPELLRNTGNNYVYVAYTYVDRNKGANPSFPDAGSPYHFLYEKIVRLTYNRSNGTLSKPVDLITGLPVGNDHVSGRLKIGPDSKLYFTIGDQGHNQLGNFCLPIEAQRLPTQQEVSGKVYAAYVGKSLRLNLDGSIPGDNPRLAGVISHVYTYGHRNMQGIDFGPDGTLYASEQGPKTDDEINILKAGSNYGWPHVAGLQDNKAYEYARWADASTPCSQLTFSDLAIDPSVPREPESAFKQPFVEPIATMFTVPTGYNFHDPVCKGVDFICWPTVGASSIEYYASNGKGIPGWDKVLLVTTLKRGSLYVLPLTADGKAAAGHFSRYFQSENRYRDTAVSPDGRTIYIATDPGGLAEALGGGSTGTMQDPGAILAFTYVDESSGITAGPVGGGQTTSAARPGSSAGAAAGITPQFTAQQAAAGKTAWNSNCAACHGNTMTNGTFGPPLAGEYFRNKWTGLTVRELYDRARTMPPSAPASLADGTYADIVAYVLEVNGFKAGNAKLPAGGDALGNMTIR
ncbi:MAG: glucose/sorbosone family PQQ-dependent dehydrogenase [Bryobacteraceae bacterium]